MCAMCVQCVWSVCVHVYGRKQGQRHGKVRPGALDGGNKSVSLGCSEKWVSGLTTIPVQQGEEIGAHGESVHVCRATWPQNRGRKSAEAEGAWGSVVFVWGPLLPGQEGKVHSECSDLSLDSCLVSKSQS